MSKQQLTYAERHAYFTAFGHKCAYCDEAIDSQLAMEIDHVLNEALDSQPDEFRRLREEHKLPETFDLASRLNRVCACKRCNSKKGSSRPTALIAFGLDAARKRAPIIEEIVRKQKGEKKIDSTLSRVGTAIETGVITREYVGAVLGIKASLEGSRELPAEQEVLRIFGNASKGLLSWPQRTEGKWLERPELDSLLANMDRSRSFTVLLGEPGSGKSALLAHVGEGLSERGIALLALKADVLPPELGTVADLDEYLGTPAPVVECLKQLAMSQPVVLLIDQLDAVSELMVQRTSRLTALLGLVNRLIGIDNIHILLSCRAFEFKHDLRLSTLKPEPVTLHDPPVASVEVLLTAARIDWTNWPSDSKQLLRRPQHLNFFLEHLSQEGSPVLRSYHAMMESVIKARISRPFGHKAVHTLEAITATMSEEENVWLPVSRLQASYGTDIDQLVSGGLLTYSDDKIRVGFRHQTIFDFVRARAFATGVSNLAQHVLERQDSLFVRPILWSTLHYLREADRGAYHRNVQVLWTTPELRQHIRFLLISFLGKVSDPDLLEIGIIRPALSNSEYRDQIVKGIQGNPAWFNQTVSELELVMQGDDASAYRASLLLRPALNFDRDLALALIERWWIPFQHRDRFTIHTLSELKHWDERIVRMVETASRRTPHQGMWVRNLSDVVSQSRPDLAPRLIAAELWGSLDRIEADPVTVPERPLKDSPPEEHLIYELRHTEALYGGVQKVVTDSSRWHDITKRAKAAPKAFVQQVWPWVLQVATKYRRESAGRTLSYGEDHIFGSAHRFHEDLTSGLEAAIVDFAEGDHEEFLAFANRNQNSELLNVHRWLAMGYCRLGQSKPQECADYLLADPRRFALGPLDDQHRESNALISAFVAYATRATIKRLEEVILKWSYYLDVPGLDVQARFDRIKSNRRRRLRVLRSIPRKALSERGSRILAEEERALPNTPQYDMRLNGVKMSVSPVNPEKMALASREALIRLFDQLHDGTGWDHPRDHMKGGVIEASRAFGELAKNHPDLALERLQDLKKGTHEHYASEAIQQLVESERCNPAELVEVIHNLSSRGFESSVFKYGAASSLAKLAERLHGLDDKSCSLLEGWLTDWTANEEVNGQGSKTPTEIKRAQSILWERGIYGLPQENYPIMHALFLGYLLREPADADSWLAVLERHLARPENPIVWCALAGHELTFLEHADYERSVNLLAAVLEKPKVIASKNAARLIARTHHWLPPTLTHICLERWRTENWFLGPQAAAEVAMLRHSLVPEDTYCSKFVEDILQGDGTSTEQLASMRIGICFAAGEIWNVPKTRSEATRVLLSVLPCNSDSEVQAWSTVIDHPWPTVDDCSRRILDALVFNRELLRVEHGHGLVERLKELLERSLEQERVCNVTTALLDECGAAIGDVSTAWSVSAGDLVDIALTLQRLQGTSRCGLEIFERLMVANAYKVEEALKEIDRKWPA